MAGGPGGIDRNRPKPRIGHLTVVPQDEQRTIKLSDAIRRVTDKFEPPLGFRIFNKVEFVTCEKLAKPEKEALLRSAITELKKRIRINPNYLAPTSENFRVMGAETAIFIFKLSARGVALTVTGMTASKAFVETGEIPLVAPRRK